MPNPQATELTVSARQREMLTRLCRRRSSSQQQVGRASVILSAADKVSNTEIARVLSVDRNTVRCWRGRWAEAAETLAELEERADDKELLAATEQVLSDAYRSGTPAKFKPEQVVQIVALACEAPAVSALPISHWTPKELAVEAVKRGLVKSISPQSVTRFLKGSGPKAASVTLLADE